MFHKKVIFAATVIIIGFAGGLLLARSTYRPTFAPFTTTNSSPSPISTPSITPISLIAVGDIMLGRSVLGTMREKSDFTWPFHQVAGRLQQADLVFANLEAPFVDNCPPTDSGYKFCTDDLSIAGLLAANIKVVNLANNHIYNYGVSGFAHTRSVLDANGITYTGLTNTPTILTTKGIHLGFVGFNDVGIFPEIASASAQSVSTGVATAKSQADFVIATFHWGEEYTASPSAHQISLAHLAIDSGADLVVGAHPHWVQSYENYRNKPIYYSLGNFVFDQNWSEKTKIGLAVEFTITQDHQVKNRELPLYIYHGGQPAWISP